MTKNNNGKSSENTREFLYEVSENRVHKDVTVVFHKIFKCSKVKALSSSSLSTVSNRSSNR
jgi:hypothetical protein